MTSADCPRCGLSTSGHFCSNCGASLAALTCPECSTAVQPGARFCTRCGASLTGDAPRAAGSGAGGGGVAERGRGDGSLAWWITGASLLALTLIITVPMLRQGEPDAPAAGAAPFAGGAPGMGTPPDLSSMTPIQAADRLFERVMTAVERGDEATVQQFLPMALSAYDIAKPLNADGKYHLATLQRAAANFQAAFAIAEEGLAETPDHLLLLAAAGEAAEGLGDEAQARVYWQRFLDVYETERGRQLEEYQAHEFTLEQSVTHAREVLGG